jgi:hypothetical protein
MHAAMTLKVAWHWVEMLYATLSNVGSTETCSLLRKTSRVMAAAITL